MALSWWHQWAKRLTLKGGSGSRKPSRRLREKLYRRSQCERLEDRTLLAANLFLQSVVTNGSNAPVGTTAANDTLMVGGELAVQFATPANFLSNGFSGGTFYFAYDANVFQAPATVSSVFTKSLTPAQSAEINIGSNSVLSQCPGTAGFQVNVADALITGSIHRVTVSISNGGVNSDNVTASTGGVIFAINLQPTATATSTNLCLYNYSTLSKTDSISDKNASNYTLGLPTSLTQTYNPTYDFQANVVANTLPTLSLGGLVNMATGTVAPIPSVAVSGGTATVYANIANPDPSGNGLYNWTVALNYDPTQFTFDGTWGGDVQLGTIETNNNGLPGLLSDVTWTTATINQQPVNANDMEVLVSAYTNATTPVTNSYFGSLFSITFHVNTSTAAGGTSPIGLLANTTASGYPQNFPTVLTGTAANQVFSPAIPNSSLNSVITLTGGGGNTTTSTTLASSSPTVTYGNAVTFTAIVSATSTPTAGDVDFIDTSNGAIILGNVTSPLSTTATSSTWTFTTTAKTFNYTPGDTIKATYGPASGFSGSNATTTQIVNKATLTITAQSNTKTYDGTASAAATPTVSGLVTGDTVTGLSETYNNKNAGNSKTLAVAAGYTVSDGNSGGNYTVTTASSTSGVINKAALTITALTNTKTYDAATSAAATPTVSGLQGSDTVTGLSETYDSKNAGNGKTLTVAAGYTVSDGNSGGNYTVTTASSTAGVINKAALTITALTNTKTYDATASAAATPTVSGLQGSDTVTGLSETYDSKNAGNGKTLTVAAGYTVSDGNSGGNYTVTTASSTAGVINKAALTITALTNTKTYDATTSAAATPTVSGLQGSDTVTGLSETYDSKNVGNGKTLTVAAGYTVSDGNSGGNYTVTTASSTAGVINKAALTITALTNTKTYDATTSAAATPTVSGLQGSDTVSGLSETYDSKNVGNGKTLTVAAGYTVSDGNSGGNYTVTTASSTAGVIDKAALTITALTNTKTYDATTSAAATPTVSGLQGSDTVTGLSETYDSKNVGNGKTLTVAAGYTVSDGNSGGNYTVTTASSTSGVINKAALTITALTNTKTYDATASAAATPTVSGLQGSDTVTGLSETYDSKNVGNGKTLTVAAGYTVSDGNSGGNYTVTTANSTSGVINKAALTITALTNTKTYDATASAAATPTVSGLQGSDTVTGLSETYNTAAVGTGKTLTVAAGYTVSDDNSGGNYTVNTQVNNSGVINFLAPIITQVSPSSGSNGGGTVVTITGSGFTGATEAKFGANVGLPFTVVNDGKITVTTPAGTGTVDVVVVQSSDDGSFTATLTGGFTYTTNIASTSTSLTSSSSTVTYGNTVTFTAVVSAATTPTAGDVDFIDQTNGAIILGNVTSPLSTTATSSTWTFTTTAKTFNYTPGDIIKATYDHASGFSGSNATTTQIVNKATLTITAQPNTKTYDATASAAATPTVSGLVTGDTVTGLSETYDSQNAGNGKTLTVAAGYTVSDGNSGGNYTVTTASSTAGVIDKAALTITALTNTKTYDAATSAAATPTVSGLQGSDTVSGLSETYDSKNAGNGKTLSVAAGYTVSDGNSGGNYTVTTASSTAGVINKAALTITALTNTKTYDATTSAAATPTVSGLQGSDTVSGLSETYDSKNVGNGKTLTVAAGYTVSDGNSGGNYTVTTASSTLGVINKAALTITALTNTKTYDATTSAAATPTVSGLQGSDTVTGLSETYDSKNVGNGKTLTVAAGYTVSDGNSGGNYTVTTASSTAGVINKAALTITALTNTKTYDATTSAAATPTVSGLQGSDTVTGLSETYDSKNVGNGKTLTVAAGYTVSDGNSGGNYTVTTASSTAGVINKAALTITALTNTKTYDATTSAAATPTVSGLQGSDTVTGLSETYDSKNAGNGKTLTVAAGYTVSDGNSGGNYTVTTASSTSGVINKAALTITALTNTKTYDATTSAAATPTVSGLQGGDTVTGLSETYDSKNAGNGKTLTVAAGYTVSDGNSGGNYTVTTASSTAGVINKAALTITALTNTKTYDATTSAAATPTVSGLQGGDTVTGLSETYDSKNAGNGKTLTVAAGYTVSDGNSGGNYTVTTAGSTAGVINKATLTITALTNTKTYDATTSAAATPTVSGLQGSDTVTGLSETYDSKNAGNGKTLTVAAGYTVSDGNSGGNYTVTTASSTAGVINKAALTITALTNTKTYDATASAAAMPTVSGLQGSDTVTGLSETYDSKNAGNGKTLTVAAGYTVSDGNSGGNYTVTTASSTAGVINKAALTITALTNTKTYDATASAAATPTVSGLQGSDTVTGLSETYDSKNAGNGKTLTVAAGYTVSDGNSGGNYTVTTASSTAGVINKATLTITALTNTKTYDATTSAAATPTVSGLQGSDTVTGLSETYDSKNAGNGKTLTVAAGYTVSDGNSGGNYTVTTASSTSGVINKAALTITALTNTKTYDATTSAAATPTVSGLQGGDTVTGLSETYDSKNAGNGKTLTVAAGYTVSDGNSGGNYTVTTASSTAGVINKAALTITALTNTKTYDATASAAATPTVSGLQGSDTVTGLSETYDSKNAGNGKTLTVAAGYTVSDGNSGGNYTVTTASSTAGVINKATLTITALTNTKTYDATTSAAATPTVSGLQGSDTVTGLSETYDSKNAGNGKTLTVAAGYTVSDGNSGGNYTVTTASSTAGVINKAALTITALTNTKTYDATASAAATPTVSGLQGSDTVTGLSETYDSKNAGNGKTLTVAAGYTVSDGNSGGNYTVTTASSTSGVINKAALTITALTNTKTYDATASAAATPTVSGLQGSDTVSGLSETYDSKNAGNGKTLTVAAGYTVSDGNSGGNYTVTTASSTSGVINKDALTITALANTKTYDATASAAATPTVSGLHGSDTVTGLSETYDSKNAGNGKTLTVAAGYTVSDGNSGGNYTVTTASSTAGVINKAALTITALTNTKTYDATASAAATPTVSGLQGSDTVTGLSETYDSKNAGNGKTLTVAAGYTVSDGNSGGNYTVTTASSTAGVINKAALTITALTNTKTYDATASAAATPTVSGLQGSDTVTGLSETYDSKNAGNGKTLTVAAGYTVSDGNSGGNYTVTTASSTSGVINKDALTITALANTKTYDATASAAATPTVSGLQGSDTVTGLSETYDSKNAGNGKTLTVAAGYTVSDGDSGGNYTVTTASSTAGVINKAALTVTALTNTKTYDATTSAAATPTVSGLQGSDTVTGLSETYNSKNAGNGKTLSVAAGYTVSDGNSGGNYTVTTASSTSGVINKAALTITALANTKTYDATSSALTLPTVSGLQGSDTVTGLSETYDTKNVGTGKTLSVAAGYTVSDGNSGGNYTVTTASSTAGVINRAALTISALANTKVFDTTTSAAATPTVSGLQGSDTVTGLSETYDTAAIGTGKTLTVAAGYAVNDGNSGANYNVSAVPNYNGVISATAATSVIIDDSAGAAGGWTTTGTWSNYTNQGYDGNVHQAAPAATATSMATWSFTGLSSGQYYKVETTWTTNGPVGTSNRADNAPYTISGGAVTLPVFVNQKLTPVGESVSSHTWQELGVYEASPTGTLAVSLANNADGYVIADAVLVEPVPLSGPAIMVQAGTGSASDPVVLPTLSGNVQTKVSFGTVVAGAVSQKTFTVFNGGGAALTLFNLSLPTGYTLVSGLSDFNTPVQPDNGVQFVLQENTSLGVGAMGGTVTFTTNDTATLAKSAVSGSFSFPVTGTVTAGATLPGLVIDDSAGAAGGWTTTGTWSNYANQGYDGNVHQAAPAATPTATATWSFSGLTAGQYYKVETTWSPQSNRATNAPYTISGGAVALPVYVNEQLTPVGETVYSHNWQELGVYEASATGTLAVSLANNANGYVIADAVLLEAVPVSGPSIMVQGGTGAPTDQVVLPTLSSTVQTIVSFGTVVAGAASPQETFTVFNGGGGTLSVSGVSAPAGYTIVNGSGFSGSAHTATVPAGGSAQFILQESTSAAGTSSGWVTLVTNDTATLAKSAVSGSFSFPVTGTVTAKSPGLIIDDSAGAAGGFTTTGTWSNWRNQGYDSTDDQAQRTAPRPRGPSAI